MLYQVLRKFTGCGMDLKPGQLVETAGWKNVDSLIASRYLGVPTVPADKLKTLPVINKPEQSNDQPLKAEVKTEETSKPHSQETVAKPKQIVSAKKDVKPVGKISKAAPKRVGQKIPPKKQS